MYNYKNRVLACFQTRPNNYFSKNKANREAKDKVLYK